VLVSLADLYSHTFKFAVPVNRFCLPFLYCLNCTKFGQLILCKIIKIVANRRHITTVARVQGAILRLYSLKISGKVREFDRDWRVATLRNVAVFTCNFVNEGAPRQRFTRTD